MEEEKNDFEFDLTKIEPSKLIDLYQEGNYLVGKTNQGITFKQHIPNNKILNKVNGKYILQDMVIR